MCSLLRKSIFNDFRFVGPALLHNNTLGDMLVLGCIRYKIIACIIMSSIKFGIQLTGGWSLMTQW